MKITVNHTSFSYNLIPYFVGFYSLLVSLIFVPLYYKGDQLLYIEFFNKMQVSTEEGVNFYRSKIGAAEFGYFYFIDFFSFIEKNALIIFSNVLMGLLLGFLAIKAKIRPLFIFFLCISSYYYSLLFSLERLKYSIILVTASLIIENIILKRVLLLLSPTFHLQSIFLIYLLNVKSILKLHLDTVVTYINNKIVFSMFLFALCFFYFISIDLALLISKLLIYRNESLHTYSLLKMLVMILAIFLIGESHITRNFLATLPLFLFSIYFGPERLNLFIFLFLIYTSLEEENFLNWLTVLAMIYSAINGIFFLLSTLKYNDGYSLRITDLF